MSLLPHSTGRSKFSPKIYFSFFVQKSIQFRGSCLQSLGLTSSAEKQHVQVPPSFDALKPANERPSFWAGPIRGLDGPTQAVIGPWAAAAGCAPTSLTLASELCICYFLDFLQVRPISESFQIPKSQVSI